jgi:hypothetical protein
MTPQKVIYKVLTYCAMCVTLHLKTKTELVVAYCMYNNERTLCVKNITKDRHQIIYVTELVT